MFEAELDNLLNKKWTDEQKRVITTLKDNAIYYKSFIPKSFKQDIINALQICNDLKIELEKYKEGCKCDLSNENNIIQDENNIIQNESNIIQNESNIIQNESNIIQNENNNTI